MTRSSAQNTGTLLFLLVTIFGAPFLALADGVVLTTSKKMYHVGDSFQVTATVQTGGNPINAVSGSVVAPTDSFQIVDARYGNSIVSLWVEKPTIDRSAGVIKFTGGIPGGFTGGTGPLFSFTLKAKKEGVGTVSTSDIKILANDGEGTPLEGLTGSALALTIEPREQPAPTTATSTQTVSEEYTPPPDTVPPEPFVPLVSRHPSIAEDKYFVSFSATDKESGVSRYEVMEVPVGFSTGQTEWVTAQSPYILSYQWWGATVLVRAYDQAGGYTDGVAYKQFSSGFMAALTAIVLVASFFVIRRMRAATGSTAGISPQDSFKKPRPRNKRVVK